MIAACALESATSSPWGAAWLLLNGQSPITQVRVAAGLKTFHFSRKILM